MQDSTCPWPIDSLVSEGGGWLAFGKVLTRSDERACVFHVKRPLIGNGRPGQCVAAPTPHIRHFNHQRKFIERSDRLEVLHRPLYG